jgi:hypothetical protein
MLQNRMKNLLIFSFIFLKKYEVNHQEGSNYSQLFPVLNQR